MSKISYTDKVDLYTDTSIADINKVKASDMNSIKTIVNDNYDEFLNIMYALGLGSDTYSTSTSYSVGDMVIHNHQIYECTTATSGTWDDSDWTLVPIITN